MTRYDILITKENTYNTMLKPPSSVADISFTDQHQVAQEWLTEEESKSSVPTFDIEADNKQDEVEAKVLAHKPEAARALFNLNLSWSQCRLSERALRDVYTVWEEPNERNTVEAVANQIRTGESSLQPDIENRITDIANDPPEDWGTLVICHLRNSWKRGSPVLIDGNHRAVATILRAEEQGLYEPLHAYVGYSGPSNISDIRRWLHAFLGIL